MKNGKMIRPVIDHTPPDIRDYPCLIPEILNTSPQTRRLWLKCEKEKPGRPKTYCRGKSLLFWAELTDRSLAHIRRLYREGKLENWLKNKGFIDDKTP